METLYRVVFAGELVPGVPAQQIIEAFAARFQVREDTARGIILSGDRIVLKHDLTRERAQRYRGALEETGLRVVLEPQEVDPIESMEIEQPPSMDLRHSEGLFPQSDLPAEPARAPGGASDGERCPKCGADAVSPLNGVCQACGVVAERYRARQAEATGAVHASGGQGNPYAPPTAELRPEAPIAGGAEPLHPPRAVTAGRGWGWVAEGWGLFTHNPWAWIGACLLYLLILIALNFIPFIGGVIGSILGPLFTGGLMIGAQAAHAGDDFEVKDLFAGFSRKPGPLALVGAAYIGFALLLGLLVGLGMLALFALAGPGLTDGADPTHINLDQFGLLTVLPILVALLFVIPFAMAVLFAPTLVALNDVPVMAAFKLSFLGCWRNILPFLVYGLVALLLTFIAVLPLGLGLLVLMPVLTVSIYCAYRDIYYRERRVRNN
jgi:hypothetical protein